ncbi:MAG: hypothetical protein ACR2NL_08595 [Acidimicrobiia bacterium]
MDTPAETPAPPVEAPDEVPITDSQPDQPQAEKVPAETAPEVVEQALDQGIEAAVEEAAEEPSISPPQVSFEPTAGIVDSGEGPATAPPAQGAPDVAPPPPPPDPMVDSGDIAAARATAEAPPAPPAPSADEGTTEVMEPASDPFGGAVEEADVLSIGEEVVAEVVDDSREPAVIIPRREDTPEIRSAVPRPLGEEDPAPAEARQPIEVERDDRGSPAAAAERKPRVAVPEPIEGSAEDEEADLPPLDGRFRNPGLMGQVVQVLLLVSAALAVAMMVALVVLNNRLDNYATSGEGLSSVMSAESMVNTWMRPLLIGAIVVAYALLAMWARRVLENLRVFNNGMDETPVWMWLMPFVNMWVLFRHLDLAWKGSDYLARGARTWQRSVPDMWTVLFVLLPTLGFVLVLYGWVSGADTFQTAIDSNAFAMIGYFALALGLLAGVRSISNIIDRQRTRVEGIS